MTLTHEWMATLTVFMKLEWDEVPESCSATCAANSDPPLGCLECDCDERFDK